MNILMLTSETVPFSKSGGLADVVGALSSSLNKLDNSVKVMMPLYGFIDRKGFKKERTISIPVLSKEESVTILVKKVQKVEYLAVEHPLFSERQGIYGDTSFTPYSDNAYRFLLLCKAAIEYIKASDWKADILHAHDWTAGPAMYLAKAAKLKVKTVFTIHNLAYQGDFSRFDLLSSGITPTEKMLSGDGLEKRFNMLKTGLEYADHITTVSPTYAKEIQTQEQGCGLDYLLKARSSSLSGILNGIDKTEWNPAKDKFFSEHFSVKKQSGKSELKLKAQAMFNLKQDANIPLIGMISRIAEQKGFHELLDDDVPALELIAREKKCQFIIIGTGDKRYEEKLKDIGARYDNVSVNIVFSQELSHIVEGACDYFLMPSRYEPCGLNQMYSLVYGTLPIAHRTGGLADSIINVNEDIINGNGFLFDELSPNSIYKIVNQALSFYNDKEHFNIARTNALRSDFSWDESAEEYIKIYGKLLGGAK